MSCAMILLWLAAVSAADATGGQQMPSTGDPVVVVPEPNGAPLMPEPNPNELNVYLPQQMLQSQGQGGYMVAPGGNDFDAIGAGWISFRNSKNWADKSEHVVPHGETLQGQDAGDGWVSFPILVNRQWVDEPAEEQPAEKPEDPPAEGQPAELPAADGPDGWKDLSCSSSRWDRASGKWVCLPDPTTTTTTTTTTATTTRKAFTWDPISGKWIQQGEVDSSNAEEERVARGERVMDGVTYQYAKEDPYYVRETWKVIANSKGDKRVDRVARGEWVMDGVTYQYAQEDQYAREKLSDITNSKGTKRVDQKQKIDSDSYYVSFEKLRKKTV